LTDDLRFDIMRALGDLGQRQLDLKLYKEATAAYQRADKIIDTFAGSSDQQKGCWKATTYHQLGMVAQAQRAWAQAEQHYQQALGVYIEFNDRYSQGSTFINLGEIALEQEEALDDGKRYSRSRMGRPRHACNTAYHHPAGASINR
jgi:tetratricopeptide (TPR) repeat protein